ncbi:NAD+ synthase [Limnothrix sp. FACHB-1083]|uniref:NAD+ synthase n=1 Tax=unclassified Limnothrix TaxID=2632864 RepID=UPI0016818AF4|nr:MULTISPECIES: NAD+ synthase [unclassified Limnothrix]MBD2159305.1 NAD+ synthase [Limnothrix sp. FACHB-1083]MBD2193507.1 NAD+ synthase [Limnothrix sp. FACHB-1088]
MKIALAQLNLVVGDLAGNTRAILNAAQQASRQGARLLVVPELALCGYPPRDLLAWPSFLEATKQQLTKLARELPPNLAVLTGTIIGNLLATEGGKSLFNSAVLIDSCALRHVFSKRLLPTYDVFDEGRYFEPGKKAEWFTLDGIKIGVTICEDIWNNNQFWGRKFYDVDPLAELADCDVDWVVNLSASPYTIGKPRLREEMLQHSVLNYGFPIAYVNQVGSNDDLIFDGTSLVISRTGAIAARGASFETGLIITEFDPETRDFVVTGQEGSWPHSLPLLADEQPLPEQTGLLAPLAPSTDAELWSALVLGIRDYARKCGFRKIVLGLSGGIDSTLVGALAVAALGAENVLGVLMPSPYSSDHSITDALALAENLGFPTLKLPIGDLMATFEQTLAEPFAQTQPDVTEENLQSRIRGNLLMALANKFGYLLISTGNKSEMAVGYCTLYGDTNGGLAAIADVPKTRVYSLCHWLNQGQVGAAAFARLVSQGAEIVPSNVLNKPPSAELRPDQLDQDSLPPYEVLDDILDRLVNRRQSLADLVAAGHESATVRRVMHLVARAEFKRRQTPPVLKVSDQAFGVGWRMPIASCWQLSDA